MEASSISRVIHSPGDRFEIYFFNNALDRATHTGAKITLMWKAKKTSNRDRLSSVRSSKPFAVLLVLLNNAVIICRFVHKEVEAFLRSVPPEFVEANKVAIVRNNEILSRFQV